MTCIQVSSSQERGRWGQPVKPGAQERPKWEEGGKVVLGDLSLEETASNMEGMFSGVSVNALREEECDCFYGVFTLPDTETDKKWVA